eukprot:12638269-Alexandrium_andersonii.AAC.1
MHPSGASGIDVEATPGPAQRTPDAILHVRQFQLRELVIWSQRWADIGSAAARGSCGRVVGSVGAVA